MPSRWPGPYGPVLAAATVDYYALGKGCVSRSGAIETAPVLSAGPAPASVLVHMLGARPAAYARKKAQDNGRRRTMKRYGHEKHQRIPEKAFQALRALTAWHYRSSPRRGTSPPGINTLRLGEGPHRLASPLFA